MATPKRITFFRPSLEEMIPTGIYAIIADILVYATLVSTVLSGIDYVSKNKDIFLDGKQKKKAKSVNK